MTPSQFDSPSFWDRYGRQSDYAERIELVERLLPRDARSIIDIGCGAGDVLNAMRDARPGVTLMGVDMAPEALRHVRTPTKVARLPAIPVDSRSYDGVICLQVLEHIEEAVYADSIFEIERIAARYLLIGVPYAENLATKRVLCANCGRASHADGHVRNFRERDLAHLFPAFDLRRIVYAGIKKRRQPRVAVWLEQAAAGIYFNPELFICPYCGSRRNSALVKRPPNVRRVARRLAHGLQRLQKPKSYWMIALYERRVLGEL